jgi:hypothetical protein
MKISPQGYMPSETRLWDILLFIKYRDGTLEIMSEKQ